MKENCENKSVMHIVSLVLGIISIVLSLFWYITLPAGILAIVLGTKSVGRTGSRMGKAGIVTGIVGLTLFGLIYFGLILILVREMVF